MARSAGIDGVRVDRAADLGDAVRAGIASGRPYLIDAHISADRNPGGAGVWELPGLGQSKPAIGGRYEPNVIAHPDGWWARAAGKCKPFKVRRMAWRAPMVRRLAV